MKRKNNHRITVVLTITALFMLALWTGLNHPAPAQAQGSGISGPHNGQVVGPKSFDGDLRNLSKVSPNGKPKIRPLRGRSPGIQAQQPPSVSAPVPSSRAVAPKMPLPAQSFDGIPFTGIGWPPDTNGDVGPNHYIQTVNVSFAVYSKTGTLLAGPIDYDSLWAGVSSATPCDNSNQGDPVVLYDQLADRWLVSDFAFRTNSSGDPVPPYYECIGVSQTSDPVSGGWYLYAMLADNSLFNDYPKFGLWPDAYYMTANMYNLSSSPCCAVNARVWALDRAAMIAGSPATFVYFDLAACLNTAATCAAYSLLPSNLRGALPPAGSPNYLANIETANTTAGLPFTSNVVHTWKFHVNFAGGSTLTGPFDLAVASFTEPLYASNGSIAMDLVPQKGTSTKLDTLGDRLMMQNQYRNVNGTESLWLTHTINSGSVTGIRWYEARVGGGSVSLYQQGTFNPGDGNYRWMPSLAVDTNGNMAVGYSASSSALYPGIYYNGRLRTDPLGQLSQGEATLMAGGGSQTGFIFLGPITRWGDYSAMTVDPSDDCTFWFTTEYYSASGYEWKTRIGSFKFPSCAKTPTADVSIVKRGTVSGRQITFKLIAVNHGPSPAQKTIVTDRLPDTVSFVSATSPVGNCTYGSVRHVVRCPLGTLGVTQRVRVKITVQVKSGVHQVRNVGQVLSRGTSDPNSANNRSAAVISVP